MSGVRRGPVPGHACSRLVGLRLRKSDESALGRLIVEVVILLSARSQPDAGKVLKNAAQVYKVDTDAIALKVKQEFAAKEKTKTGKKIELKTVSKTAKKAG